MTLGEHPEQGRSAVPDLAGSLPQLRVRHRQVPRRRPPGRASTASTRPAARSWRTSTTTACSTSSSPPSTRPSRMAYLPQQGGRHLRGPERGGRRDRPARGPVLRTRPTTTTTAAWTSSSRAGPGSPSPIRPSLLRNNGDGTFTDVTREAGLLDPVNSNSASWADYDNDGWLDLFVCCERQPNRLYHNRGDGTFEEVAARAGLREPGPAARSARGRPGSTSTTTTTPTCSSTTWAGSAELYRNNRDGTFTRRHRADGDRRPPARLLVLGLGLRQRRLARHLRHLLRPHARGRRQGPAGPAAQPGTPTGSSATWRARASRT